MFPNKWGYYVNQSISGDSKQLLQLKTHFSSFVTNSRKVEDQKLTLQVGNVLLLVTDTLY